MKVQGKTQPVYLKLHYVSVVIDFKNSRYLFSNKENAFSLSLSSPLNVSVVFKTELRPSLQMSVNILHLSALSKATPGLLPDEVLETGGEVVVWVLLTGGAGSVEQFVSTGLDHLGREAGLAGVADGHPLEGPRVDRQQEQFGIVEEYLVRERWVEVDQEELAAGVNLDVGAGGLTDSIVSELKHLMPLQLYFLPVKERTVNDFLPGEGLVLLTLIVVTDRDVLPAGILDPVPGCLLLRLELHLPGRSLKHSSC